MRSVAIQFGKQARSNASAFDGGAQVDPERPLEDFRLARNYVEVFHGKRSISKTQAKKLAAFFHVSADLFI